MSSSAHMLEWKHEIIMRKAPDFDYKNGMHFIAKTDYLTQNMSTFGF